MANSQIIEAIDIYIADLVSARALLAGSGGAVSRGVAEMAPRSRRKKSPMERIARPAAIATQVAVQILPPKERRSRKAMAKSNVKEIGALGGIAPRGPVVVRAAEVAEQKAKTSATPPAGESKPAVQNAFQDLAREVARRLGRTTAVSLDAMRS